MTASTPASLQTEQFWSANQPGLRFTDEVPGTAAFFAAVERQRYEVQPHIPVIVQFERWRGKGVLEVGCGIATDGINFDRTGSRYTGAGQSRRPLTLAQWRFDLEGLTGSFIQSRADRLPFADESFDLLFSHGVIHHMENADGAVREFERVLRPGGMALVMLYHRNSFNYNVMIMRVRRALAALVMVPGLPRLIARLTRELTSILDGHRALIARHGARYRRDGQFFLSNNTDGPGNPLSTVDSRAEAAALFRSFASMEFTVRHLNLRLYPGGSAASPLSGREAT